MKEREKTCLFFCTGSVAIIIYIFGGSNNIFAKCIIFCIYNYVGLLCFDSAPYTKKLIDSEKVFRYLDLLNSLLPQGKIKHISFK